jgi:hypothetical protein
VVFVKAAQPRLPCYLLLALSDCGTGQKMADAARDSRKEGVTGSTFASR